jgi:hypothetical protein
MKLNAKEDIEAPIDFVFASATDFVSFERSALRRGAEVRRVDTKAKPGVGSCWDLTFGYRGKPRQMRATIATFDPPQGYSIAISAQGLEGLTTVELVALSRNRTRIAIGIELTPKTIAARILIQSLKLARGNLSSKLSDRVAGFADEIETRFRKKS